MPTEKEKLQAVLQDTFNLIFENLWSAQDAHQLAERYAHDLAEQKILLATAGTPEKKAEHETNIKHLVEMMKTEVVDRYIRIGGNLAGAFAGAIKATISILLNAVFLSL